MSDPADQIGSAESAKGAPLSKAELDDVVKSAQDVPSGSEPVVSQETLNVDQNSTLRIPDSSDDVEGCTDVSLKDLSNFCRTGLVRVDPAGHTKDDNGLIPAILHPYLGEKLFRRPWPLIVSYTRSGIRIESLTEFTDSLVGTIEEEGDAGELLKRALIRIENLVSSESTSGSVLDLRSALQSVEAKLVKEVKPGDDRYTANLEAIQLFLSRSDDNSKVFSFGEQSLTTLLVETTTVVADARRKKFVDDVEWLITQLDDLLRVDEDDSEEGHSPEKLAKSVGGAYTDTIDFSSLSHLLDDAPHGIAIKSVRRQRIRQVLSELSELSADLYSDSRTICFTTAEAAIEALRERVAKFARLFRARHIAQLEVENQYDPEVHDSLFDDFEYESIPITERKTFPPLLVHLQAESNGEIEGIEKLVGCLGEAGTIRLLVTYSTLYDENAVATIGSQLASSVVGRGDVFVQQSTASQVADVVSGLQIGSRARGSSVMSVFMGNESQFSDPFLTAGLAADSRTVPSFRFDPENGNEWAEWFTASSNEQPEESWATAQVSVVQGSEHRPFMLNTTCADVLALDPRFGRHFVVLSPALESTALTELTEYLQLEESSQAGLVPFIWTVDDQSNMLRTAVGPATVRAANAAARRWKIIQEWSGINSSVLRRGLLETEEASRKRFDEAIAEAQADFDRRMSDTTSSLANSIVENIAASLLGLSPGNIQSGPTRPAARVPAVAVQEARPEISDDQEQVKETDEDDDFDLELDEAYIDTPLCTTCNECTDLNGLIFAYNEDKQAFIKDATAGPFRDLVLAAEKCPVRIIHPGKPHDQSEKDLDDLIERAKAFA